MQIEIDKRILVGFNDPAKKALENAALEFCDDLVQEANRIEAAQNPASGNPQVTSSNVENAAVFVRRGFARPKQKIRVKVLRILAAVLSMAVGLAYDATRLQDNTNMLIFVFIVALAILTVTLSTIME